MDNHLARNRLGGGLDLSTVELGDTDMDGVEATSYCLLNPERDTRGATPRGPRDDSLVLPHSGLLLRSQDAPLDSIPHRDARSGVLRLRQERKARESGRS